MDIEKMLNSENGEITADILISLLKEGFFECKSESGDYINFIVKIGLGGPPVTASL